MTGIAVYGEDAPDRKDWKALRGNAKATNFALSYGGGGSAVQRSVGVDKNEGWRIKRSFDQNYRGLVSWWGQQHSYARKHGFVKTAFGRVYPLPDIYHEDGGFRSKAERNAVNGPIQGAGADIIKVAMALVYKHIKKKDWFDEVFLIACMHDELVLEIDGSVIEEAIRDIEHIMTRNPIIMGKRWPVPLTTDVEIGTDWTVPWDLTKMREGKKDWKPELAPYFHGAVSPEPEETKEVPAEIADNPEPVGNGVIENLEKGSQEIKEVGSNGSLKERKDTPPETLVEMPIINDPDRRVASSAYTHRVTTLSLSTVMKLAEVIVRCRDQGTTELILVDPSGNALDWSTQPVFINETTFHVLSKEYGLR